MSESEEVVRRWAEDERDSCTLACHVLDVLSDLDALRKAGAELATAASCLTQCAQVAYGDDRKMCCDNTWRATEAMRSILGQRPTSRWTSRVGRHSASDGPDGL